MPLIKERFDNDKDFLIKKTNEFLKSKGTSTLKADREQIKKLVAARDFTAALQQLEILREAKNNIKLTEIAGEDGKTGIIIRDARNANNPRILDTEGFEMQYLNVIRGALDIVDIMNKPNLKDHLMNYAIKFINSFYKENKTYSQEQISISVKNKVNDVVIFLEKNGIGKAHTKLNIAKNFQNFNDRHHNIVTISNVKDSNSATHTVIEAEIALKELTQEQKQEYEDIKSNNQPDWFLKMASWEQELVKKYTPKIVEGNNVISTQLRQIVGMKNAFEKITAITDKNFDLEILHSSKHAGTLGSKSYDENSRQHITDLNAEQAQEWIGNDHILHANTLNSGPANLKIPQKDTILVFLTRKAMNHIGGYHTNTAFNQFRRIAAFSNCDGAKEQLHDLANSLEKEGLKNVRTHLIPRGRISKLFGINKPKGNLEEMLNGLPVKTIGILRDAVNLKKDIEKADVVFSIGTDKENIYANVSRKLNYLTYKISTSKDPIFKNVKKHEVLTMCASGKDRTGLAQHDQSSSAIADKLGMKTTDIDQQLLKSGHTAGQAGGVYAGGTTIGCYGTLQVTSQGFPHSRKVALQAIVEVTAANNNIKKLKQGGIIDEWLEQKNAQELPNMGKVGTYKTISERRYRALCSGTSALHTPQENDQQNKLTQDIDQKMNKSIVNNDKFFLPTNTPNVTSQNQKQRATRGM